VAGAGAVVHTRATPQGPWETCPPRGGRECPRTSGLEVGHGPTGAGAAVSPTDRSPLEAQDQGQYRESARKVPPCHVSRRWGQSVRAYPTLRPSGGQEASPRSCCPAGTAPSGGGTSLRAVAAPPGRPTSRRRVSAPSALSAGTGLRSRSGPLGDTAVMAGSHSPLRRCATASGRGAAPVWGHPRRREAAASTPRADSEAATRRLHVRWSPTHGEPQDHPSCLTGSGSSDGQLHQADITMQKTV
jgi:hypothetical protein